MALLRLSGLRLGYGRDPDIMQDVTLSVDPGETVAILGPSGGGKTTLLKAIAGLLSPRSGTLEVADATWPTRPPPGTVGYVPQRLGLVRHASVLENVQQGALHETGFVRTLLHRPSSDIVSRAETAIRTLGLTEKRDVAVHALSGGQQRRVAVARALVQRPRLLLADEFLGELDPATTETVLHAVKGLQRETGMGLVIVEHQLDQALRIADHVLRLKGGQLTFLEEAP